MSDHAARPAMTGPLPTVVGFTGTRDGMTDQQQAVVYRLLRDWEPVWFEHGDCVGADEQAFGLAKRLGIQTGAHPCIGNPKWRANTASDTTSKPLPPLERNRDIVNLCHVLIAAPKEMEEVRRSGTWATIRYAHKIGKHHVIVWPNGETTEGFKPS